MKNELSVVEQLSYATIRIEGKCADGYRYGTGFIISCDIDDKRYIPLLVTNGHVIDGVESISLCFTTADGAGRPDGKWTGARPIVECDYKFHPQYKVSLDGDLCAIVITPFIKVANDSGYNLVYKMVGLHMLATDSDYADLMQLDEVAMVGYPNAIADEVNNQPIFRRGVLATSPSLNYDGRKEFLTDIATIGGSSGSPVLLISNGVSVNQRSGSIRIGGGSTCKLLGVHRGGFRYDAKGQLTKLSMPEADMIISSTRIPINLGIVIKTSRVLELVQLFL